MKVTESEEELQVVDIIQGQERLHNVQGVKVDTRKFKGFFTNKEYKGESKHYSLIPLNFSISFLQYWHQNFTYYS